MIDNVDTVGSEVPVRTPFGSSRPARLEIGNPFGVGKFSDHLGVARLGEAPASEAAATKSWEECQEIRSAE